MQNTIINSLLVAAIIALSGCQALTDVGADLGQASGTLTPEEAAAIRRTGSSVAKSFADITPEQEYYIGRSVAATIFARYAPLNDEGANRYLNILGSVLSQLSKTPETFAGYHFQILDSDEVNAFAAPGGLILVTRGMLKCCRSEDALAAVLAHEIGHIEGRHGLRAIKQSRLTSALTILAVESAKHLGSKDLAALTQEFEGSVSDVTSTLMTSGYSHGLEKKADAAAVRILMRAGYDPNALIDMLQEMNKRVHAGSGGFGKTHPPPGDRIADVRKRIGRAQVHATVIPARQARFAQNIGRLQ